MKEDTKLYIENDLLREIRKRAKQATHYYRLAALECEYLDAALAKLPNVPEGES